MPGAPRRHGKVLLHVALMPLLVGLDHRHAGNGMPEIPTTHGCSSGQTSDRFDGKHEHTHQKHVACCL